MLDPPEATARVAKPAADEGLRSRSVPAEVERVETLGDALANSRSRAAALTARWRNRTHGGASDKAEPHRRWLLHVPDVGPSCEAILADRLFFDLRPDEREGLLEFIRKSQDESGAWLDLSGRPDLSLTVLGWWARAEAGDDRKSESMIRAVRMVHALGGAQRANFSVRLWLAMAGQIPWSYLPAIPSELFLFSPLVPLSPARFSPWARGMLTPYVLIARAPTRLHLCDASDLLLRRKDGSLVAPRLTRHGLAGDLLQAFDRTVKLSRKFPRGPIPRWATARAERWIDGAQQQHGGWFSLRPTLSSLIALRVMGATSDDPRIRRGLDYLRNARGLARINQGVGAGAVAMAQGLGNTPLSTTARLMRCDPQESDVAWLLRQELSERGPWQERADAPAGGWPVEPGARHHLDLEATCMVLEALSTLPASSSRVAPAWAAIRRATDVLLAMQEAHGGFSRFERGESDVFMRHLPWMDADLLAYGDGGDSAHVRLSALALARLGRIGFRLDDDRIARGMRWLERQVSDEHAHREMSTLAAVARCVGTLCPDDHPLRREIERRVRARQHEDGSFGDVVDTSRALVALLDLGPVCVQADRAARHLVAAVEQMGDRLEHVGTISGDGFGLSSLCYDPSAGVLEITLALEAFARQGGTLGETRGSK